MNIEKSLASYFKYAGYVMAVLFLAAIILGIAGGGQAVLFTQVGVIIALAIPIIGILIAMTILFRRAETKYVIITIILAVFILITVIWRMSI